MKCKLIGPSYLWISGQLIE